MFSFLCKVFGHSFKYNRRYYRCNRCGIRRCDLEPLAILTRICGKGGSGDSLTVEQLRDGIKKMNELEIHTGTNGQ